VKTSPASNDRNPASLLTPPTSDRSGDVSKLELPDSLLLLAPDVNEAEPLLLLLLSVVVLSLNSTLSVVSENDEEV